MRALVFCASESNTIPFDVNKDDYVICADSGLEYALRCGVTPNLFVGDCDSIERGKAEALSCEKIYLPAEKDCTDTFFGVEKAIEKGFNTIIICGGMFGRIDHTIANISTLRHIKEVGKKGFLADEKNIIYHMSDNSKLLLPFNNKYTYISVFALKQSTGVTLKNFKYPLNDYTMKTDYPIGTSNEFLPETDGEISLKIGELLVIISF